VLGTVPALIIVNHLLIGIIPPYMARMDWWSIIDCLPYGAKEPIHQPIHHPLSPIIFQKSSLKVTTPNFNGF